jgi:hypothetical protein
MVTGDLGILPIGDVGAMAFDQAIKIVVLPGQRGPLTGMVTGLACVCDYTCIPPREPQERLWIDVWLTDGKKNEKTRRERAACEPSGHWTLTNLTTPIRAAAVTLALTTSNFDSDLPPLRSGGEVIAVLRIEGERVSQS